MLQFAKELAEKSPVEDIFVRGPQVVTTPGYWEGGRAQEISEAMKERKAQDGRFGRLAMWFNLWFG